MRYSITFLIVLLPLAGAIGSTPVRYNEKSFFAAASHVTELSHMNVDALHPSAFRCAWLILFYDDACPHCANYAPMFSKLAVALLAENPPTGVLAINCHDMEDECRAWNVSDVPQLIGIPPRAAPPKYKFMQPVSVRIRIDDAYEKQKELVMHDFLSRVSLGTVAPLCSSLHGFFAEKKEGFVASMNASSRSEVSSQFSVDTSFHQEDVANALFYAMWHEVAMSPSAREVLLDFLSVVERALPGLGAGALVQIIKREAQMLQGKAWKEAVLSANIPYSGAASNLRWIGCKGSSWAYRGYSCGLWLLLHAVMSSLPSPEANAALHAIRNYIISFFLCSSCREHFARIPFDIDREDKNGMRGTLWLWRAHNEVNEMLAGSTSQDPKVPHVIFPTKEMCFPCYSGDTFVELEVYQFLHDRYKWKVVGTRCRGQACRVTNIAEAIKAEYAKATGFNAIGLVGGIGVVDKNMLTSSKFSGLEDLFLLGAFAVCALCASYVCSCGQLHTNTSPRRSKHGSATSVKYA